MLKNFQRYSGVVGVVIVWTGIVVAMRRADLGLVDTRPISYLSVYPNTARIFSLSLLISAALFISFAYYLRRVFKVNNKFMAYFLVGQLGQIFAAILPYGQRSPYKLAHTIAAFTLAFSLPLLIREFTRSQTTSPHYSMCVWLLRIEQLTFVVGIGLFVFTKGIAPMGEALPAVGFHFWIIVISYLYLFRETR